MTEHIERKDWQKALAAAFPHTIPVLTGFLALGIAYGIVMQTKGYGVVWSVLMSAIAFCGSMQYAAITILTTAFEPLQAFLLSLMINARYLFYSLSMLQKYKGMGKIKGFLIYTLCDETFSIVSSVEPPKGINRKMFFFFVSALDYVYWVAGTMLGGILGQFITFSTEGLDFVLTALFVVLFLEQLKKRENRIPTMIGVAGAVAALCLFGAEQLVIPAMLLVVLVLWIGRRKLCS